MSYNDGDGGRAGGSDCLEKQKATSAGRNAWTLSWIAERADGWRDEKLRLVNDPTNGLRLERSDYALQPGEQLVCEIETPSCQPSRPKVVTVNLDTGNGASWPIDARAEGWDAVFWSESAIAKFLYPYYVAHRLWDEKLQGLKEAFEATPGAFAIKHKAPSASEQMTSTGNLQVAVATRGLEPVWLSVDDFLAMAEPYLRAAGAPSR